MSTVDLSQYGIQVTNVLRNAQPSVLYEQAMARGEGEIVSTGALAARSGEKTGRSPKDKRIVDEPTTTDDIWWGDVNIRLSEKTFEVNRQRAIDFLNTRDQLYVVDGLAGWDEKHQIKVRIICLNAYHALFMHNMLIRPTPEQLEAFGEPDYVIFNGGLFPANPLTNEMSSSTSVDLNFQKGEFVILGTQYAGEMKKSIFYAMNYDLPDMGVFPMHCSANTTGDNTAVFFGLSGTGKTTLLHSLMEVVGDAFTECSFIKLDGVLHAWRRWLTVSFGQFRRVFLAVHNLPAGSLLILDGIEQLGLFARQIILVSARLRHVTVLATSHRNLFGMRVVHQTSLDAQLIHELVGQLLEGGSKEVQAKVEGWVRDYDLDQVANLREFWFEIYDLLQPDLIREAVPSTARHFENSPAEV